MVRREGGEAESRGEGGKEMFWGLRPEERGWRRGNRRRKRRSSKFGQLSQVSRAGWVVGPSTSEWGLLCVLLPSKVGPC